MEFKIGQKLKAIDVCAIKSDGRHALTIGKEYEIIGVYKKELSVIDDEGDEHSFDFEDLSDYFEVENKLDYDWQSIAKELAEALVDAKFVVGIESNLSNPKILLHQKSILAKIESALENYKKLTEQIS